MENENNLPNYSFEHAKNFVGPRTKKPKHYCEEIEIVENKENVGEKSNQISKKFAKYRLTQNPERKYFDSADWMLTGQSSTYHSYATFVQPKASSVVVKKKMAKSRQYFDSADWAMNNCIPQIQPKLTLLKS